MEGTGRGQLPWPKVQQQGVLTGRMFDWADAAGGASTAAAPPHTIATTCAPRVSLPHLSGHTHSLYANTRRLASALAENDSSHCLFNPMRRGPSFPLLTSPVHSTGRHC